MPTRAELSCWKEQYDKPSQLGLEHNVLARCVSIAGLPIVVEVHYIECRGNPEVWHLGGCLVDDQKRVVSLEIYVDQEATSGTFIEFVPVEYPEPRRSHQMRASVGWGGTSTHVSTGNTW